MHHISFLSLFYLFVHPFILKSNTDQGIVDIRMYFIPNGVKIDTATAAYYAYRYYVHDSLILRKDTLTQNESTTTIKRGIVKSTLTASLAHPSYLIDRRKQMSYIYYYKDSLLRISKTPLPQNQFEIFYRTNASTQKRVISLQKDSVLIAGLHCFKGTAVGDTDTVTFYYSKEKLGLHSPLNNFLSDFPFEVMSIVVSAGNGTQIQGQMLFTVSAITATPIPDSLLILPASVPQDENVPVRDMRFF